MTIDRIRQLEARSRKLEPDAAARDSVRRRVLGYAEGFLERLDGAPAYRSDDAIARRLREAPISEDGRDVEELLGLFGECRYLPPAGDADAFNQALVRAIHRDGRVFVSSTRLGDAFFLRAAVLSFRTYLEHVDLYLKILDTEVRRLLATR